MLVCSQGVAEFAYPLLSTLTLMGEKCTVFSKPLFDVLEEKSPHTVIISPEEHPEIEQARKEYDFNLIFFGISQSSIAPDIWCLPENTPAKILKKFPNSFPFRMVADVAKLGQPKYDKNYEYDLLYISDKKQTRPEIIDFIIRMSVSKHSLCIVGPEQIPVPQYLGNASLKERNILLSSCKIGIDFPSFPNTLNFYFRKKPVVTNGGDYVEKQVEEMLGDAEKRDRIGLMNHNQTILSKRTNFHITAEVFGLLGMEDIVKQCQQHIEASGLS